MSVLELEQEILNLDLESRIYLADSLKRHIPESSEMDCEDEWIEEVNLRIKDYEDGKTELIDEDEIEEAWLDLVEQREKEYLEGKVKLINGQDFIKYMREKHL